MTYLSRISALFALCLLLPAILTTAYAQQGESCFDLFDDLTDPTFSCADASYFVNGADGGTELLFFGDANSGLLGADFDGFDIFDQKDGDLPPPDNLLDPFFSDVQLNSTSDGGQITNFDVQHRGRVAFTTRNSLFQGGSYGSQSRITFIPFTTDDSTDPVNLDLDFSFEFTLKDPRANATRGGARAAAGVQIIGDDPLEPLFDFEGLAELDLEFDDDPEFFGDFDGPASSFAPSGPGIDDEFDIDVEFETTFPATPGEPLTLDTDTFGSIFTDGFESGDTSAWSASSGDTFVVSISSENPLVRFTIVTEASSFINAGINDAWVSAQAALQGFFFTVFPDLGLFFLSWFTFDSVPPDAGVNAVFGAADQRWVSGLGPYSGNTVTINVELTSGGIFNGSEPLATQQKNYGTITIVFISCNEALLTYDFPSLGLSGQMTLTRAVPDNVALCEALAAQ